MNKVIGYLGHHTIYTHPAPDIQPGQQTILVAPADLDGLALLRALTGATPDDIQLTNCPEGQAWRIEHNPTTDQRLVDMVNLCAALRYSAPQVVQLPLYVEAWDGQAG